MKKKNIICPNNLLKLVKTKIPTRALIINAVKPVSIESTKQVVDAHLIILVIIVESVIENYAKQLNEDISKHELIRDPDENSADPIAAKLASMAAAVVVL